MATYRGHRGPTVGDPCDWIVEKDGQPFDSIMSQCVLNHSPDGFSWGYYGSGPAQLALALLLDVSDRGMATQHHHDFMYEVVGGFPQEHSWVLTGEFIRDWVAEKERRALQQVGGGVR